MDLPPRSTTTSARPAAELERLTHAWLQRCEDAGAGESAQTLRLLLAEWRKHNGDPPRAA